MKETDAYIAEVQELMDAARKGAESAGITDGVVHVTLPKAPKGEVDMRLFHA